MHRPGPRLLTRPRRALVALAVAGLLVTTGAGPGGRPASAGTDDTPRPGPTGAGVTSGSRGSSCRAPADRPGEPEPGLDGADAVTRLTLSLVDRSRPTPAITNRAASPCRLLPTEVRYPANATGPLPLVVVAHGLDGSPSSLALLLDAWADAGYVVAAPTFPTTKKDSRGASLRSESVDQAADMSFVIDQVLRRSRARAAGPLHGLIDSRRIGVAGMSLGGLAVYGLISNTCCRDTRVKAAILMAAVRREFPNERYEHNRAPVLLVQGDADGGYHNSLEAYPELAPPKWFITLHGSVHSPPFEVPPGPEAPLVYASTAFFWDRYLKNDTGAARKIVQTVQASTGRATLQRDLG